MARRRRRGPLPAGPARGRPGRCGRSGGRSTGCRSWRRPDTEASPGARRGGPGWWRRGRDKLADAAWGESNAGASRSPRGQRSGGGNPEGRGPDLRPPAPDHYNSSMPVHVLAIAAHRDDVELTCAGTLLKAAARGHRTAILDLTAGEIEDR